MLFRIMKSQIATLVKQAVTTFTCKPDLFQPNLEILKSELAKTTEKDVNLNPVFKTETLWQRLHKAPVTYIDIYEDSSVTIGIFVLKPNMKLPLHNHPEMHGLIKVIYGKVKIRSYSLNTEKTKEVDMKCVVDQQGETDNMKFVVDQQGQTGYMKFVVDQQGHTTGIVDQQVQTDLKTANFVTAEICPEVEIDPSSECCLLEPKARNLHEIESVQGPAAFIDILSPPYDTVIENNGLRQCNYFEIKDEIHPGIVRLQEVNSPSWYWTDTYLYDGPKV